MAFSSLDLEARYQEHVRTLLAAGDPSFYGGLASVWLVGSLIWGVASKVG